VHNRVSQSARVVAILALLSTMGIVTIGLTQGAATAASTKPVSHAASTSAHGSVPVIQEWNWDTVADEPAENATLPAAVKVFDKQYNVKVDNVEMTLEEQDDKLPLAFSTKSSAPTVSQTNEGFGSMGRLVTDKELLPLTSLNKTYNWYGKVGKLSIQFNSFTPDGKTFGVGTCYGVPDAGSLVGIYYNKKMLAAVGGKVPTSWSIFVKDLGLLHKGGKVALAYAQGNPTAYQPVHTFYTIANEFVAAKQQDNFVFHIGKPSIDTAGFIQAATVFQDWAKDGYLSPGYQGLSDAQALSQFTTGKAGFFIEGSWYAGAVQQGLGNNAGFWVPKVVTGGPGEGWSIPTYSPNPKLAAEWINLMLSPSMQASLLKYGDVPVVKPSAAALAVVSPSLRSAAVGWSTATKDNTLVPYLDYASPNFLTQEMAGIEELLAGQITATSLMSSLQSDYTQYWSSQS
jgi:raffinose/stachyose/melibiose transport system substrate-binding protein